MADKVFSQAAYVVFLHNLRGHKGQRPFRPTTKQEFTGERDRVLSQLHRQWGFDVPACDIDFLEYDRSRPIALIEYKKRTDWDTAPVLRDANLKALICLGTRAKVPVFCVFYAPDHSMFRVVPLNTCASAVERRLPFCW